MVYECSGHHVSLTPGTCHVDGCFRRLKPSAEPSPLAQAHADNERLSTLDLDQYVQVARGHGPRWWLQ